jgi:putative transposase
MRQVYPFRIDQNDDVYKNLKEMSRATKDLYNQTLWEIKEHHKQTGKILSYPELDRIMKTKENLDGIINYRRLPAQVAQQTLRLVAQNITAFFKALADYKQHPDKYQGMPKFPQFLPKDGYFVVVFTNQKAAIDKNGVIRLTKAIKISIPKKEFEKYKNYFIRSQGKKTVPLFAQIRIVPKFGADFFHIEIVYDRDVLNSQVDVNRVASIDLGVNNLVTLVDSNMDEENRPPLIINGKAVKSVNQYYNKQRSEIQQRLSFTDQKTSKQLHKITDLRNRKIEDIMHKASRFIIEYCLIHAIGHIVIGYNPEWKQSVQLGKRNNQNFVQIPFLRLIELISYKAQLAGIKVTVQEESYTSKCSALDLENIARHEDHAYAGKRVKRGLFVCALGIRINADVNAALNILRKVIGDEFLKPLIQKVARLIPGSGYLCYPLRLCF